MLPGSSFAMHRLLTLIAALSTAILLLSTAIWIRGFFATDVWASCLYTHSARTLDFRSIEFSSGWLFIGRTTGVLPPGSVPQSPKPMDSTWSHEARPPNTPTTPIYMENESFYIWHNPPPSPRPNTTGAIHIATYFVAGVRLLLVIALSS